jgi:hypothetical protein
VAAGVVVVAFFSFFCYVALQRSEKDDGNNAIAFFLFSFCYVALQHC